MQEECERNRYKEIHVENRIEDVGGGGRGTRKKWIIKYKGNGRERGGKIERGGKEKKKEGSTKDA